MKTQRPRRHRPLYPALIAAAAVGVMAAACGPDLTAPHRAQPLNGPGSTTAPDAGPLPSDFIGGDVAFETLPDGGTIP
jgi:hypothetical protein